MDKNSIEIPLASGFSFIVTKEEEGTVVALGNPNGYIVYDAKLTKEQEDFFVKNFKCNHTDIETWNHGYHSRCRICGEEDVR